MRGASESWVTLALDDCMGWEALVLAKSMKRCFTSKKLTILLLEGNLSPLMKELLRQEFHFVETIENVRSVYCGGEEDGRDDAMSQIHLWNLRIWDKCAFIASRSLVLESVDDLFNMDEFSAMPVEMEGKKTPCLDVFIFQPKKQTFHSLLQLSKQASTFEEVVVQYFWKSWINVDSRHMEGETLLSVEDAEPHLHNPRPKIAKFDGMPWLSKSTDSVIKNKYVSAWLDVYHKDLLPQLQTQEGMKAFLIKSASTLGLPLPLPMIPSPTLSSKVNSFESMADAIAIVGMSCRFPGSNNVDEYWSLMAEGRCAIQKFPVGRRTFDVRGIEEAVAGYLFCPVDEFDAKFFGISPREAPLIDPQQRLLLEVIWEALEDAGLNGFALKETPTGVFVGIIFQDYDRMLPRNGYIGNEYHHRFLGNALSASVGRISHFMGFTGPNVALESGGSSSLAALHLGCESLRSGESNLVITGGVNLIFIPRPSAGASGDKGEAGDRLVSAEGVATLVLKRYADALNDGDNIRAIIRGSALGHAGTPNSLGTPDAHAQARIYKEALRNANVQPWEVDYIETQGIGTTLGGAAELSALEAVYSGNRKTPLLIGSVKSNIGQGEASAGIASIFKLILSIQKEAIPKNVRCEALTSELNLKSMALKTPCELTPWRGEHRMGGVSAFSLTGTLVHVLLQATPHFTNIPKATPGDDVIPQLITISAKTAEALEAQRKNYLAFFKQNLTLPLIEVAYATNVCRTHFQHRLAILGADMGDLVKRLEEEDFLSGKVNALSKPPPITFLFTGQASQYFGMGKGLYQLFPPFKNTLDFCAQIYKQLVGVPLKDVIWESEGFLQKTEYAQPAIFCIQVALIHLWKHFGIRPNVVLGHSVGEYCAAVCADVITIADGLKLVVGRSRLVEKLKEGRMVAIKASIARAEELIEQLGSGAGVDVAAINSPTEVVLSGSPEAIAAFEDLCSTYVIKTHRLSSSHAFHSRHIDAILDEFGALAAEVTYSPPSCTYISSTLARKMEHEDFTTEYWQCHLRDTVQFSAALNLLSSVSSTLIEIGPQPVLLGLAMANARSDILCCPSMRRVEENWTTFYTSLGKLHVHGIPIHWALWYGRRQNKLNLPTYAFQRQKFWFVLKDYTKEEDETEREGIYFRSKRAHPILGYHISTGDRRVFVQSKLLTELPYVNDCRIGDDVILPSGAVIELFLAAANQQRLQSNGSTPLLALENIEFHSRVKLEVQTSILTTIAERQSSVEPGAISDVTLFTQTGDINGTHWTIVATGQIGSVEEKSLNDELPLLNLTAIMSGTELPICGVYSSLRQNDASEIQFGKNYQRIRKVWKTSAGEILSELSTAVQDPENVGSGGYICFPTILDALIETGRISQKVGTSIISKIQKFTWYAKEAKADKLFSLANPYAVYLFTKHHILLAKLEGLTFHSTQRQSQRHPSATHHFPSSEEIYTHDYRPLSIPTTANFSSQRTLVLSTKGAALKCPSLHFVTINLNTTASEMTLENDSYDLNGLYLLHFKRLFDLFPLHDVTTILYDWTEPNSAHHTFIRSLANALLEERPPEMGTSVCILCQGIFALDGEILMENPEPLIGYEILQSLHQSNPAFKVALLDSDEDLPSMDMQKVVEVTHGSGEGQSAFAIRSGVAYVKALTPLRALDALSLPSAERLQVALEQRRSTPFSALHLKATFAEGLGRGEVEVAVEACALNYRDLFIILRPDGFLPPPSLAIGLDIAGRVTAVSPTVTRFNVGDAVLGIMMQGGGLSSHVRLSETYLAPKPQGMNYTSAATIPLTFLTAWKAVVEIGKLTAKDRVLVYLGIGGTGLAFIQICQHVGATVFALAGTSQRRQYLKSIGVNHIYSSTSTDYAEQILRETNGDGVTCVVNSFSTQKFKEANLKVCGVGAKFFEIGTLHIWAKEEAGRIRPDVQYHMVNLLDSSCPSLVPATDISLMMRKLCDLFSQGQLLPLPYKNFQLQHLPEAFLSFHEGKTLEKVVVRMPRWADEESRWKSTFFNKESTYVVTGDGSFDLCKWMLDEGAEYIILLNTAPTPLRYFESKGHIEIISIKDYTECLGLNDKISALGFPPLRGLFHTVLSRSTLHDSNAQNSTWILHELTRNMFLEFFVVLTCGDGISYGEGICRMRHSMGLPGLSCHWPSEEPMLQRIGTLKKVFQRNVPTCVIMKHDEEKGTQSSKVDEEESDVGEDVVEESFQDRLEQLLRHTLRLPVSEVLDLEQNFSELGVDSLMGLEIGSKIQILLPHIKLSSTIIQEFPTLGSLLAHIEDLCLSA